MITANATTAVVSCRPRCFIALKHTPAFITVRADLHAARAMHHTGRFYCSCVKSRQAHTQTSRRRRVTALIQFYECANIIVSVCADSFFDLCCRLMACHYFAKTPMERTVDAETRDVGFGIIYIFVMKVRHQTQSGLLRYFFCLRDGDNVA